MLAGNARTVTLMGMYNKLFTKILDSSIWLEPTATRIVWMTFIAVMDEDGFVAFAAPGNVANRARVTEDEAAFALAALEGPDPNSSDPDNDGRRIERVPGGWIVLNAGKYRALTTRIVVQEQTRKRVAKHRAKLKGVTECNAQVTEANGSVTPSESESESDTKRDISVAALPKHRGFKKPTIEEVKLGCAKCGLPDSEGESFWHHYESKGWVVGKVPMRSWPSALANWKKNWDVKRFENPAKFTQKHEKTVIEKDLEAMEREMNRQAL